MHGVKNVFSGMVEGQPQGTSMILRIMQSGIGHAGVGLGQEELVVVCVTVGQESCDARMDVGRRLDGKVLDFEMWDEMEDLLTLKEKYLGAPFLMCFLDGFLENVLMEEIKVGKGNTLCLRHNTTNSVITAIHFHSPNTNAGYVFVTVLHPRLLPNLRRNRKMGSKSYGKNWDYECSPSN